MSASQYSLITTPPIHTYVDERVNRVVGLVNWCVRMFCGCVGRYTRVDAWLDGFISGLLSRMDGLV